MPRFSFSGRSATDQPDRKVFGDSCEPGGLRAPLLVDVVVVVLVSIVVNWISIPRSVEINFHQLRSLRIPRDLAKC